MVAVNLLKFRPDGGYDAYLKYIEAAMPGAPSDMKILYTGKAGPELGEGDDWDFVIIVEYSSVDSFASSVMSRPYREDAEPYRAAALEKTVWLTSFPAPLEGTAHS